MLIAELYDVCERGYVDRDINKHKILIPQHPKFHKTPPPPSAGDENSGER